MKRDKCGSESSPTLEVILISYSRDFILKQRLALFSRQLFVINKYIGVGGLFRPTFEIVSRQILRGRRL